jgi:hypothetical protein
MLSAHQAAEPRNRGSSMLLNAAADGAAVLSV